MLDHRLEQFLNGDSEIVNGRFTLITQQGGAEAVVMGYLAVPLATPQVAALLCREAGIVRRGMSGAYRVGLYGGNVYLLTMVHMGARADGLWGHVGLIDQARDQTESLRGLGCAATPVWPYGEALDRACQLIDRHEDDTAAALMQAQRRLVEEFQSAGPPSLELGRMPDARERALISLVKVDHLHGDYDRPSARTDRRPAKAKRRRRKR